MNITLSNGYMRFIPDLNCWLIISDTAIASGADDIPLFANDIIDTKGNVYRDGRYIGSVVF